MAARKLPGVFSLEGEWSTRLTDKSSVLSLLETLEQSAKGRFIHRRVGTATELAFYLNKWLQKQYRNYPVLQLAFHGEPREIQVGKENVSLSDLAKIIDRRAAGRVIYFGACAVLDIDDDEIEEFRKHSRARAIIGYTEDVEWIESAAFELLLFHALSWYERIDAAKSLLERDHAGMVERLGMKFLYAQRSPR